MATHPGNVAISIRQNSILQPVGTVYFEKSGMKRFQYDADWLKCGFAVGPDAPLVEGELFGRAFGFLEDMMPDRWGRRLIQAGHKGIATDFTFLLGVDPKSRMGALELDTDSSSPQIPELLTVKMSSEFYQIVKKWQNGAGISAEELGKLIRQGSSLGGSRPKASIMDADRKLRLVKFPSIHDDIDVTLFEKLNLDLAQACGIKVPGTKLLKIDVKRHCLILDRFDRTHDGSKLHYASAMNLCGKSDGEDASYLDILQVIEHNRDDCLELWKRLAFNVMVNNCDDHLRNHGFLMLGGKWCLSPVFDLESDPLKSLHRLELDDSGSYLGDIDSVIEISAYYGLTRDRASNLAKEMSSTIGYWKTKAQKLGATGHDIGLMAPCYRYATQASVNVMCDAQKGASKDVSENGEENDDDNDAKDGPSLRP